MFEYDVALEQLRPEAAASQYISLHHNTGLSQFQAGLFSEFPSCFTLLKMVL